MGTGRDLVAQPHRGRPTRLTDPVFFESLNPPRTALGFFRNGLKNLRPATDKLRRARETPRLTAASERISSRPRPGRSKRLSAPAWGFIKSLSSHY